MFKKSRIYNALVRYSYSSFSLTILEYIDITNLPNTKKLLLGREQYDLDNILPKYNILKTAGSLLGFKHSTDTIVKFKKAKEKDNNPMFGKFHSKETKLNLSDIRKGKLQSKETKFKISLTNSRKVYIFIDDDSVLNRFFFKSLDSYSEAAKYFNCSIRTISR